MRREAGLFCLAVASRLAYLSALYSPIDSAYWTLAGSLVHEGQFAIDGVPVTDFEPLYPMVLAVARLVFGDSALAAQVVQILVASTGAVFLYRLALALSGVERAATISGVLFAVHPLLVRQASMPSDLSQAATLLVAFAYSFVAIKGHGSAVLSGLCLGLAVLTRSMILPLAGPGAAILLFQRKRAHAALFVLAAAVLVAPLMVRNYRVSTSVWPTRSGLNLFVGNSSYGVSMLPEDDVDLLQGIAEDLFMRARPDLQPASPGYDAIFDRFLTRYSVDYMLEDPLRTVWQKMRYAGYMFSPRLSPMYLGGSDTRLVIDPHRQTVLVEGRVTRPRREVMAHALASSFVLCTAVAGVFLRRRALRADAILWGVVATFVAVHMVYFPATRYMGPPLFVLLFYSGVALEKWAGVISH